MRAANNFYCHPATSSTIASRGQGYLVYTLTGEPVELDLSADKAAYQLRWLDTSTGELQATATPIAGGGKVPLQPPAAASKRAWVAWLAPRA
jgi:hypothetical protein